MNIQLRRLQADDLPSVLCIQTDAYPTLAESPAAIADRLLQAPDWCWGAEQDGRLCAYFLTHPWRQPTPPAWNHALPLLPAHSHTLYLHDLAIGRTARGSGLASRLVGTVLQRARHARFEDAMLVAVQDSRRFWQRQGFAVMPPATPDLATALSGYGDDAVLMTRRL